MQMKPIDVTFSLTPQIPFYYISLLQPSKLMVILYDYRLVLGGYPIRGFLSLTERMQFCILSLL